MAPSSARFSPPARRPAPQSRRTFSLFFFFQAEDGIRDVALTGVQTCALPILVFQGTNDSARGSVFAVACSQGEDRATRGVVRALVDQAVVVRRADLGNGAQRRAAGGEIGRASGRGRGQRREADGAW